MGTTGRWLGFLTLLLMGGSLASGAVLRSAVGAEPPDIRALQALLSDPDRGVRYAAVQALGKAGRADLLERARKDDARVVRAEAVWWIEEGAKPAIVPPHVPAELPSTGPRPTAGVVTLARTLRDPRISVRARAAKDLARMGRAAAVPTARAMATGNYGALHHGLGIFDQLGRDGAPAVPVLIGMLGSKDVNVREIAARCLRYVGPGARAAARALARALHDPRLCVVANAALALGRIGVTPALRSALRAKPARVRAYAAFALGWALGERRRIDQVAYERRLPVVDVPRPDLEIPNRAAVNGVLARESDVRTIDDVALLRRAIWSSDLGVSLSAAKTLDETQIDPREAERVMELLLPEGQRAESGVDFDALRSIIGSSELGAFLEYVALSDVTKPDKIHVYANLHRVVRAEHMPVLCWFERHFPGKRFAKSANDLWIAWSYTSAHARLRTAYATGRDPGPTASDTIRAALRHALGKDGPDLVIRMPIVWVISDHTPTKTDVPLLIRVARHLADRASESTLWGLGAIVRCLGRASDASSLALLRELASNSTGDTPTDALVHGALARRGEDRSLAWLADRSRRHEEALLSLFEARPAFARSLLVARAQSYDWEKDPETWLGVDVETAFHQGNRLTPAHFEGLDRALLDADVPPTGLLRLFRELPGCQTRAMAHAILKAGQEDLGSLLPDPEHDDRSESPAEYVIEPRTTALLHSLAPDAFLDLCLQASEEGLHGHPDVARWACHALVRLGQPTKEALAWVGTEDSPPLLALAGPPRPAVEARLRELEADSSRDEYERREALRALAYQWGLPLSVRLDPDLHDDDAAWKRMSQAIRDRDWDRVQTLESAARDEDSPAEWQVLASAAAAGDEEARAEMWSAFRAARYRWLHYEFEATLHTLGEDPGTYPHWISDLQSNCCRVTDGLAHGLLETPYGIPDLWPLVSHYVSRSPSATVTDWFAIWGDTWRRSPLLDPHEWIQAPRSQGTR